VGLHGAGLMNILYARHGAVLVELFGSYGTLWAKHRRAVLSIGGGYVALRAFQRRDRHYITTQHARAIRHCVSSLRRGNASDCAQLPYVTRALEVGSTWDCVNPLEKLGTGKVAPTCPEPDWDAPGETNLRCWDLHKGFEFQVRRQPKQRCADRHSTVRLAIQACRRASWCGGVTRDGGMMCGDEHKFYELRYAPLKPARPELRSWVRRSGNGANCTCSVEECNA